MHLRPVSPNKISHYCNTGARGKQVGRKPALSPDQAATARTMRGAGMDITTISATLKVSRATIYRATEVLVSE